jgi:hypothetical protein
MGNCALPRSRVRFDATGLACGIFINLMYASRRQLTAAISLACGPWAQKACPGHDSQDSEDKKRHMLSCLYSVVTQDGDRVHA